MNKKMKETIKQIEEERQRDNQVWQAERNSLTLKLKEIETSMLANKPDAAHSQRVEELTNENAQLKQQVEKYKGKNQKLKAKVIEKDERVKQLVLSEAELKSITEELDQQTQAFQAQKNQLEIKANDLEIQLKHQKQFQAQLEGELRSLQE